MKPVFTAFLRLAQILGAIAGSFFIPAQPLHADSVPVTLIVVVGAPGEDDYDQVLEESATAWLEAGKQAHADIRLIDGPAGSLSSREQLATALSAATNSPADLWLVFIGHGTFDGRDAKFNLIGPDISATELAGWLKPVSRRTVIFQGASASAPFINRLSAPNRIIITATRSGTEQNYARFGANAAAALASPQTDIDQDGQNSALEIFLAAARLTVEWYQTEGRLATEHPLIDDNGDGRGTPADWFQGLRVVRKSADGLLPDGLRANQVHLVPSAFEAQLNAEQRNWRDGKELDLARLREKKSALPEEMYLADLETLLLELARFYAQFEQDAPSAADQPVSFE